MTTKEKLELESMIKRFDYKQDVIHIKVKDWNKGSLRRCMAESIKLKLLSQIPVRIAVLAQSSEPLLIRKKLKVVGVIISGKLSQQRPNPYEIQKGYLISSGQTRDDYMKPPSDTLCSSKVLWVSRLTSWEEPRPQRTFNALAFHFRFHQFLDTKKDEKDQQKSLLKTADVQWCSLNFISSFPFFIFNLILHFACIHFTSFFYWRNTTFIYYFLKRWKWKE